MATARNSSGSVDDSQCNAFAELDLHAFPHALTGITDSYRNKRNFDLRMNQANKSDMALSPSQFLIVGPLRENHDSGLPLSGVPRRS